MEQKKLKIGWFTFTCCEDSTIIFTELLNTRYQEWKRLIDFQHVKVLQSRNIWGPMNVAFVEGAITAPIQEEKLKKIRSLSQKVVAIGACACIGMPSSQRNQFDPQRQAEIAFLVARFQMAEKVKRLDEVITVDAKVNGCPMDESVFLNIINQYLHEFKIIA